MFHPWEHEQTGHVLRQSEAHGADLLRTRRAEKTGAGQPLGHQTFSSKSEENHGKMVI